MLIERSQTPHLSDLTSRLIVWSSCLSSLHPELYLRPVFHINPSFSKISKMNLPGASVHKEKSGLQKALSEMADECKITSKTSVVVMTSYHSAFKLLSS